MKGVCVGLGYFSQFHLEAWQRLENVEIIAICDSDINKAELVANTQGIKSFYSNAEEMLSREKPDFLDIITPPETHHELCMLAIKHGIHIICQKPVAPAFEEAEKIAIGIQNSDVRMMVHENFRFQPWHREIKALLDRKTVGEKLHTINLRMRMGDGWQEDAYMNRQPYFREMERLLMYETGIHFIDVFRFYSGEITKVYARLNRFNDKIKGEDFAWVQFDFASGTHGFIDANRYNESNCENPRLTFGTLLLEGDKGSIRLYEDGKITVQKLGQQETPHAYYFEDRNFSGDCVYFTQKHFISQLVSGEPFETAIDAYLQNIGILEKVYESHEKGMPVKC
ncbi:Gfo/Idh/MocA family protein [Aggregatimonas sangjinii]|uniref:Gfo/Idh/MocA family protein n=1 Tax=Aggregatimonas sangjinii TaxID=2583587 RepID=UPI0026C14027